MVIRGRKNSLLNRKRPSAEPGSGNGSQPVGKLAEKESETRLKLKKLMIESLSIHGE